MKANRGTVAAAAIAVALAVGARGAGAQQGGAPGGTGGPEAPGHLTGRVTSASDSSEHYALYVPSSFDPSRSWPVLFVMDPRGRALLAMDLFRSSAEARGWIVLSSYNTVSDSTVEPNERAVEAMLEDAQELFPVDTARLYFAGFSGTARLAWLFALRLGGHAAGIVGFGGGFPNGVAPETFAPLGGGRFAFFGGAGVDGFNYDEVRRLEPRLRAMGIPARVVDYPGGHGWAPAAVATQAVDWLEMQAMRSGRAPEDGALVDSLLAAARREAADLEASGNGAGALRAYRDLVEDFSGLRNVEIDREHASRLARSPEVRRREAREQELREESLDYRRRVARVLAEAGREEPPPSAETLAQRLDLKKLLERAADGDSPDAAAARRMLAQVEVQTRFYGPRTYLATGRPDRALALLGVADRISPHHPVVCLGRARALARMGRLEEAFQALRCAREGGVPPALLRSDPYLAPLRSDPRWPGVVGEPAPEDSASGGAPERRMR